MFQLSVLEKHINVPSYRGLCRALEITPGRTETTNNPLDLFTLDIYSCISYCLLMYQLMVACTCRYLSDSGYPVNSWDLIFLFLHLISKYCWLHSHKLLWLERPGFVWFCQSTQISFFAHIWLFRPAFPFKAVIDHLDSKMLYCSFLMKNLMLCDCYCNFILLVMQFYLFFFGSNL